jgi:ribosomal protein S18 acetylase RimI-like enzyme
MRLDTLSSMKEAIKLYQSIGFKPISPYCTNPSDLAVYLELDLTAIAAERTGPLNAARKQ